MRPFLRKPFGRRIFCPGPALARSSQPAPGMLGPCLLVPGQNPSPQQPSRFSNSLKKSFGLLPPVYVAVENTLDLDDLAVQLVENQPAAEGRRQDKEAHVF